MKRNSSHLIHALLQSDEPSIRWKAMVRIAGEDPDSPKVKNLQHEIRKSPRAVALIAGREDLHADPVTPAYARVPFVSSSARCPWASSSPESE